MSEPLIICTGLKEIIRVEGAKSVEIGYKGKNLHRLERILKEDHPAYFIAGSCASLSIEVSPFDFLVPSKIFNIAGDSLSVEKRMRRDVVKKLKDFFVRDGKNFKVFEGHLLTSPYPLKREEKLKFQGKSFLAADMESFFAGKILEKSGKNFVVLRVVSEAVDEDISAYEKRIKEIVLALNSALQFLVKEMFFRDRKIF